MQGHVQGRQEMPVCVQAVTEVVTRNGFYMIIMLHAALLAY